MADATNSASPVSNLDPEELTVKAEYFLPIETNENNLRLIKAELSQILRRDGFHQVDGNLTPLGPSHRTMTFQFQYSEPDPPTLWKLKDWFGLASEEELTGYHREYFFERLGKHRSDLPFEIDIRFRAVEVQEREGYKASVTAIPALLQKYKQQVLSEHHRVDTKTAVSNTKREVSRIFDKLEAQPLRKPYTDSEVMESSINETVRDSVLESEYGQTALGYYDEGQECFQRNNLRAALNCYILSIEWVIISYLKEERDRDVISEEAENDSGYYFMNLVDLIAGSEKVSQKTIGRLKGMNYAERRWMAHHKRGDLGKKEVASVKERLEILTEELFYD